MTKLVLIGGGHAHLFVLEALAKSAPPHLKVVLISPNKYQLYSGMLPGWIAGHYTLSDCHIPLDTLANKAGAEFVQSHMIGISPDSNRVHLSCGLDVEYDFLSINAGSSTYIPDNMPVTPKATPIKPLERFADRWADLYTSIKQNLDQSIEVVGAGAAGVEIILAIQWRLTKIAKRCSLALVIGSSGLLPQFPHSLRQNIANELQRKQIYSVDKSMLQPLPELDSQKLNAQVRLHTIFATGAKALECYAGSGLAMDAKGFVLVNAYHQSVSHSNVFAAGDACARHDCDLHKSGVHAVRSGPILAHNLIAITQGKSLKAFLPRKHALYIMALGGKDAIAVYGRFVVSGKWVWVWKRWLDTRFVKRFSNE